MIKEQQHFHLTEDYFKSNMLWKQLTKQGHQWEFLQMKELF